MTPFDKLVLNTALALGRKRPEDIALYVAAERAEIEAVLNNYANHFDHNEDGLLRCSDELKNALYSYESLNLESGMSQVTETPDNANVTADGVARLESYRNAEACLRYVENTPTPDDVDYVRNQADTWLRTLRWSLKLRYGRADAAPEPMKEQVKQLELRFEKACKIQDHVVESAAEKRSNDELIIEIKQQFNGQPSESSQAIWDEIRRILRGGWPDPSIAT